MKNFPKRLLLSNRAWVANRLSLRTNYFMQLAKAQHPQALWIGCSDSRVPAEEITGCRPGELFVHRNIANVIQSEDSSLESVLYYSLIDLKVAHIIVCGHTGCGGIHAALSKIEQPTLKNWLKPVTEMMEKKIPRIDDKNIDASAVDGLVRKNVALGVETLNGNAIVREAWKNETLKSIHGWVYGLENGIIEPVGEILDSQRHDVTTATLQDIQLLHG